MARFLAVFAIFATTCCPSAKHFLKRNAVPPITQPTKNDKHKDMRQDFFKWKRGKPWVLNIY